MRKSGFPGPIVMAVGVCAGESDNGFWLGLFGEINGKLMGLLNQTPSAAIQGGFYAGYLNRKYGFGLVTWDFIWGDDTEGHEGRHKYELSVYKLVHGKFVKVQTYKTRRKYNYDHSQYPPRELGIRATDQRLLVPGLKKFLT